jgi:hypothetical protein
MPVRFSLWGRGAGTVSSSESRKRSVSWATMYVFAIIGLGLFILYRLHPHVAGNELIKVLSFGLIIFVTEVMPVELPRGRGTVSVSYAVIYASILLLGPEVATWLAALATLRLVELTGHVSLKAVFFNRAQLAMSAASAGLAYAAVGGAPGSIDILRDAGALLTAASVYSLVNITTVVVVMYLTQRLSFWGIWVKDFKWMIPHYLALTPLGVLIAVVESYLGLAGVLLLFVPLIIARYSLQLYAQMRKAYLATIQAMVAAIEARDPYTAGHSRRVARYTVATARALHLPEDQTERLEYAAWLHDVGKLAVPDQILQKTGSLTPGEWAQMKRHPETGANILKQIKLLGRDVDVILHHHEKWNGEGYPDYMRGSAIPLGARLIAIADAYEAMTSVRPYRARPMSREEAVCELKKCAASQFDPDLVGAFATALEGLPETSPNEEDSELGAPFRAVAAARLKAAYQEAAATVERAGQDPHLVDHLHIDEPKTEPIAGSGGGQ